MTYPNEATGYLKQNYVVDTDLGSQEGNAYPTWAAMYAEFKVGNGQQSVSVVTDVTVPSGAYDLHGAILYGTPTENQNAISFATGAAITNCFGATSVQLVSAATTPIFTLPDNAFFTIDNGYVIAASNEVFLINNAHVGIEFIFTATQFFGGAPINLTGTSTLDLFLFNDSSLDSDTLGGDAFQTVNVFMDAGSFASISQSAFSGTLVITLLEQAGNISAIDPTPLVSANLQDVIDNVDSEGLSNPYIFNPSISGITGNSYQNWSDLFDRMDDGNGWADVIVDGSAIATAGSPIPIPSGTWNLHFGTLYSNFIGDLVGNLVQINPQDGCVLQNLPQMLNLTVHSESTSGVILVAANTAYALQIKDTELTSINGASLIAMADSTGGPPGSLALEMWSSTLDGNSAPGNYEVLDVSDNNNAFLFVTQGSFVADNAIRGGVTSTVTALVDANAVFGNTQTNFAGVLLILLADIASMVDCTDPTTLSDSDVQTALNNIYTAVGSAPATLNTATNDAGNVGGGEDTLILFTVPGGTLVNLGDYLTIEAAGFFATNNNNKRLRMYYGSTVLIDTTAVAQNGGSWNIKATVMRIGATNEKASAVLMSDGVLIENSASYLTCGETLSGDVDVKCTGEATSNDDVVQAYLAIVKYQGNA